VRGDVDWGGGEVEEMGYKKRGIDGGEYGRQGKEGRGRSHLIKIGESVAPKRTAHSSRYEEFIMPTNDHTVI